MFDRRGPADVAFTIRFDTDAPGRARRALERLLSGLGRMIDDRVVLAASELVTNVVVHTHGGCGTMRVWAPTPTEPSLRLEVEEMILCHGPGALIRRDLWVGRV